MKGGEGQRESIGREVDAEIDFHLEMRMRELRSHGHSAENARREAERRFGNVARARAAMLNEDIRAEQRMERREWFIQVAQDVRLALRQLRKRPGFAVVAVVTLAIGIGANTAIFSAADHVLLRPLPYADVERVVTIWETDRQLGDGRREVAPANFLSWKERNRSFEAIALAEPYGFDLVAGGPPEPLTAWAVTEEWFEALGVQPLLGRAFTTEEHVAGNARVVVLSHRLWRDRFGSDRGVLGGTLQLDGAPATVVGVLPPSLDYPAQRDVWSPLIFRPDHLTQRTSGYMQVVARLRPGVTIEAASADMQRVAAELATEFPATNATLGTSLLPLEDHVLGGVRPALLVLLGAVALVLLIACANVASLLLARRAERERELAVRAAIGAGRGRLVWQLVTESGVLAMAGGLLGLVFAFAAVRAMVAAAPPGLPRMDTIVIDGRILVVALAITLGTALLFGLAPAFQFSRPDLQRALGFGARAAGSRARNRLRSVLVIGEIALALVLLIGAGLLGRSFLRLLSNDLGFAVQDRASVQIFLWDRAPTAEGRMALVRQHHARLSALPGVQDIALVSALPFHPTQIDTESEFTVEGQPFAEGVIARAQTTVASPEYFDVLEIPLRAGRTFTDQDRFGAPDVAIINETMARRYFAGENPVGKRITIGVMGRPRPREIVGVVGDTRPTTLDSDPRAELYVPYEQSGTASVTFVASTSDRASTVVAAMRNAVWAVDPMQSIYHSGTVEDLISATLVERRFHLSLLGGLSLVALVLAVVGIYGLIRFATEQRRAEIGVRMALGARRGDVTRMIVLDALRLALPGTAIGILAALGLARFLRTMLYGVTPADPATFIQLAGLMLGVATAAAYLPAMRAAATDPVQVLRE